MKILIYDSTPRAQMDRVDIFDGAQLIQKKNKEIALLTCEGASHEETEMIEAIMYRARMMGANAIILLPQNRSVNAAGSARSVYRAKAVSYEAPEQRIPPA